MTNNDFTHKDVADVISGILTRTRVRLVEMNQVDLERFWFFQYDESRSKVANTYEFYKMLNLYGSKCRQWEDMHNGSACVVERVRDTYLLPKIEQFIRSLEGHNNA